MEKRIAGVSEGAPACKGEAPLWRYSLNIQINGKENIWINNNTAKLPLEIDVILIGTINRPIIVGKIEAIDGEVYFRKNRFKVISGRVDFTDPEKDQSYI